MDFSKDERVLLFQKIAQGDSIAFEQVYEMYRHGLFGIAFKLTKSKPVSEDIVQDVFKDLWNGRHNLVNVEEPSSYIFSITYRKSFQYLKQVSRDRLLFEELKSNLKSLAYFDDKLLETEELKEILQKIIEELPPRRQLIFKMSREKGLSYEEIAKKLNISPLTVKKQMTLALQAIRMNLANVSSGFKRFL